MPDGLVVAAVAATIVVFTFASSSVPELVTIGRPLRWLTLAALAGLAVVYASRRGIAARAGSAFVRLAIGFGLLGLLSAAWSVSPSLSAGRAVSFLVLLAAALALARGSLGRDDGVATLLSGVVAGVAAVSLAGFALLAVDADTAVQWGWETVPDRLRGLGENPNTVSMLQAVALPIAFALAVREVREPRRALWVAACVLFVVSIGLSQSRGALMGATIGLLVAALTLEPAWRGRVRQVSLALGTATCILALGFVAPLSVIAPPQAVTAPEGGQPGSPQAPSTGGSASGAFEPPAEGEPVVGLGRLEDEVGQATTPPNRRWSRLSSSGRLIAWSGAVEQAAERPLLGYGFGTEESVFIDRFYVFQSSRPENSYIGVVLQLGLVGLGVLLALVLLLLRSWWRLLRGVEREQAALAGAAGAVAAALVLGLFQSYLYSVGNVATVSVWICAFVLAAAAHSTRRVQV